DRLRREPPRGLAASCSERQPAIRVPKQCCYVRSECIRFRFTNNTCTETSQLPRDVHSRRDDHWQSSCKSFHGGHSEVFCCRRQHPYCRRGECGALVTIAQMTNERRTGRDSQVFRS